MEEMNEPSSKKQKRTLLIGGAMLAICAVMYFSYHTSSPSIGDTSGTIGAAKKYRPEQITGRDVRLSERQEGGIPIIQNTADDVAAAELRSTASALAKTAQDLAAKAGFDRTIAADLARTAAELGKTAQAVLDRQSAMEKSVMDDLQSQVSTLEKSAEAALVKKSMLNRTTLLELQKKTQSLERNAMAAQPAFERTAAAEFSRTALSLERTANDLKAHGLDRNTVGDLQKTSTALEKTAQVIGHANSINRTAIAELVQQARGLDRTASAMFGATSTLSRSAAADFGQRAQAFQKQAAGLERTMSVSLDQKAFGNE